MKGATGSPALGAALALAAAAGLAAAQAVPAGQGYREAVLRWRQAREERLKADGGWLAVAGLFWLAEGENRFGADPSSPIVLPPGSAPPVAGAFSFHEGRTVVRAEPGVVLTLDGKPITSRELRPDSAGDPDVIALGDLTMHVIKRGDRYGIRLKDRNSRFRREFTGLRWFPVRQRYRVTARFVPYDPPRRIDVPTILGTTEAMRCPGYVLFTLDGRRLRLEPVLEEPDASDLFFIFRDETSGEETYPSGRFLHAGLPAPDGTVVLDFNKAYNPPCAFTPYATCPLPPEGNTLPVRLEAGELDYGHHAGG